MKKFFKKHRALCTIVLVAAAAIISFLPQLIFKLPWIDATKISGIELIVYSSQIVSAFFVIVGTVIAVWQYYLSSTQKIDEFNFSRVEKAIELSNYYKDNILTQYSYAKKVFDECGIMDMIESKRDKIELQNFDVTELKAIYSQKEINYFENLHNDKKFIEAIVQTNTTYNMGLKGCEKSTAEGTDKKSKVFKVSTSEMLTDFFQTYITQTLNNAEYFAMSFTHNTADESVIFQSIYPTYLEMCFVMYFYIARYSDPAVAKLYTNIAELYCIWRKREQEQKEKITKQSRNAGKALGTVVNVEK